MIMKLYNLKISVDVLYGAVTQWCLPLLDHFRHFITTLLNSYTLNTIFVEVALLCLSLNKSFTHSQTVTVFSDSETTCSSLFTSTAEQEPVHC